MKKIIIAALLSSACYLNVWAQDDCVIPMMVYVPQQVDQLVPMAQSKLETRLRQIVTQNGMDGAASFSNFCVVANVLEGSKEVLSGTRPLITLTTELELFVGNISTGEKFASTSIMLNGAGRSESKAYTAAFGRINKDNKAIENFLEEAKQKALEYYNTQAPNLMRQAKSLASRREYEEALCLLTSVPVCSNQYDEVQNCMWDIYQQFVDYDCAMKVNKARNIWNASQNKQGAAMAGAYLASIDPASSCWEDAMALSDAIRVRIGDKWEFSKELQRDAVMLEKTRIEAMRAIGVAYGTHQKARTVHEHWFVR